MDLLVNIRNELPLEVELMTQRWTKCIGHVESLKLVCYAWVEVEMFTSTCDQRNLCYIDWLIDGHSLLVIKNSIK